MKRSSLFLAAAGNALVAYPAFAAEEGLPQFDTSLFPEQLFWLAVSFSLLYVMMKFVALPGVEKAQDKRKNIIDTELNTARAANEQAKSMAHEADKALADARAKATTTINDIKAEASKLASEQQTAQGKQLGAKLRDAETAITKARDAAMKDIDATAADLAATIVENISGKRAKA